MQQPPPRIPELPARLAAVLDRRRDAVEAWGFKLRGKAEAAGAGALRLLRAPVVMVRPEHAPLSLTGYQPTKPVSS